MSNAEVGRRIRRSGLRTAQSQRSKAVLALISIALLVVALGAGAAQPVITGISIPDVAMSINDVVTATISVQSDSATVYTLNASTIGGYTLGSLSKSDSTTYTAQFTIASGGTDYASGADIPTNVTLADGGLTNTWNTAISQANDPIDANRPTVTSIDRADSDPTNNNSIDFTVTFSEAVSGIETGDFVLATSGTSGSINSVSAASGTVITVTVDTVAGDGTLGLNFDYDADGSVLDGAGNPAAADFTGQLYTIDNTKPDVTINQKGGQADPTNTSPVVFTVVFDEPINDATFTNADVNVGGTATTGAVTVTEVAPNDDTTFEVSIVVTADGTVEPTIPAGGVEDSAGNTNTVSTSTDNSVTFDGTKPDVTINQSGGQADPTPASPVLFTVVFDEPINDATFTNADVSVGGTATTGTVTVTEIAPNDDTTFEVSIVVTADGTIIPTIPAGGVEDVVGNTNTISTSTDNSVTYDATKPNVTIDQAGGQVDPTNMSPVVCTVVFDEPINDATFTNADVNVGGTATTGIVAVLEVAPNDDTTFEISIVVTADGTVVPTIPAGGIEDYAANTNTESTSTDNSVTVETVKPDVTIDQKAGQADPTNTSPVVFTVAFDEPINDATFTNADVSVGGTATTGAVTVIEVAPNDDTTFEVSIVVTVDGTVVPTIPAGGVEDPVGNTNTVSTSTDNTVTVDTNSPDVNSVDVDTAVMYEGDLIQQVTVTFDETMDTAIDPTITFGAGTFVSNSDGAWSIGDTVWIETFTLTDNNQEITVVTVDVTGAKDVAGNDQSAYAEVDEFDIDTLAPTVTSITRDDPNPTRAAQVYIQVDFSEDVNGMSSANFSIDATGGQATASIDSTGGADAVWWVLVNTVDDATGTLSVDLDSSLSSITDDAGNELAVAYTAGEAYDVDRLDPQVISVTVDTDPIYEGDTELVVTVDFDEAMTGNPSISFSGGTWVSSFNGGYTNADTRWTETFTLMSINEDISGVTIAVSGTADALGNAQQTYTPEAEFDIDTVNPTVVSIDATPSPINDAAAGSDTFTVSVVFDETMDTGTTPGLDFSPDVVGGVPTLSPGTGSWSQTTVSNDTYSMTYDVSDQAVDEDSVTIDVMGAKDAAGNDQEGYSPVHEFEIDMLNPTVSTVVVDTNPVYESDLIQQVVVTFDEAMGTGTDPTITFGAGTFASNSDGGWTVGNTIWTETFTLTDNNEEITVVTVDVADAVDAAGNAQIAYAAVDEFDIDTVKPTITGVSTSDSLITDADTPGNATFVVTIEFSEDMNTGIAPTVSFSPTVASTLTLDVTSGWLDSDTYEAKYDTADGNVDHDNIQIDATGTQDVAGNLQEDYTPENEFGIDTVNPTVTAVAVDDTLLSDSDSGSPFTVTVDFSEPMQDDGTPYPTITFSPSVATTLSFTSESWPSTTRYAAIYDVSDAGVDINSITIDVTFAEDENLNDQQAYTAVHEFEIDTENPTVTLVTLSDNLITDADVGDTFTVTIDYSEPMLTTSPSLVYSPNLDTTLSFQAGSSGWQTTQRYVASYTILDGNTTVLDDDITITNAQDLAGNIQVAYNYDDQLDVDTENPYFHDFTVTGGAVDANCLRVVTFTAKVTDPNGTMTPGDITVTTATVTNTAAGITAGDVYDIQQTSDSGTTITITGKVDVEDLTGCPARVTITLDAEDSVDNDATQQAQSDDVVDTTIPVISGLRFDSDDTHVSMQVGPYLVDDCGHVVIYFSATINDNCCIVPGNVNVTVTLPTADAILEDIVVSRVQNGQGRVDVTGEAVVRCLDGPDMSRVQVNVTATDCCGNVATPVQTGTGEGLVNDIILPIPKDDPRQDMVMDESAVIDPLVEVRIDEFGTYRLILRESTPVRIDIMGNDADNLSHNVAHPFGPCIACGPCGGQTGCCAVMYIHEIVKHPSYGTATIEDDTGDCAGGTVIRYAPDRGYLGPDYFTYRTRDAFGNVSSVIATVYLQTVPEVWMEDVFAIACEGATVEFTVSAADLFIDPTDPSIIQFVFSVTDGPEHGVIGGSLLDVFYTPASQVTDPQFGVLVPSLDFSEAAAVTLTYTPADGFTGIDAIRVRFEDPFGGLAHAVVNITVGQCGNTSGAGESVLRVNQGERVALIVPFSFESIFAAGWGDVTLESLENGQAYGELITVEWSEQVNRHILAINTEGLPVGSYKLTIPLGTGETVTLTIEVGEAT